MKFGIGYAYGGTTWDCNLDQYKKVTKKMAGFGFDMLEVSADHIFNMSNQELQELDAVGREYGITFGANSGPARKYDLSSPDEAVRNCGKEYFEAILDKMAIIHSPTIAGAIYSFWPADFSYYKDKKAAWKHSIPLLREIGKKAEQLGIECALEVLNRNETYILTDCAEAMDYCNQVGVKSINILLDTYHMNIEEDNMYAAIRKCGNMLGHFHTGECNRKLPGMNNSIDWTEIGKALRDIHYNKGVVMEPFLQSGGAVGNDIRVWRDLSNNADSETMDRYLQDALKFLKSKCEAI